MDRIRQLGRKQGRKHGGKHGPLSALLLGGFVVAAVVLFMQSAGATSVVQLQSPAYLRSRGAAAQTTVLVACNARSRDTVAASSTPARATLTVTLVERVGRRTAGGVGSAVSRNGDFRCDGGTHDVDVNVLAKTGAPAFVKGAAFGQVTLKVCNPICRSVTDSRTIRIR